MQYFESIYNKGMALPKGKIVERRQKVILQLPKLSGGTRQRTVNHEVKQNNVRKREVFAFVIVSQAFPKDIQSRERYG